MTTDTGTGRVRISGACRLVLQENVLDGRPFPAIDAMNFVEPASGWPHVHKNWKESEIAESAEVI